jgi:hypothetical protein
LGGLGIDGKIILEYALNRVIESMSMGIGFIWFRTGTGGKFL